MTGGRPFLRKWGFRAAALLIGCVVGFLLTETILRVFRLFPSEGLPTVTTEEFDRVPGLFQPGREVVLRRVGKPEFQVRINSLGYRGEEFPLAKPEGEFRIVTIGDSFTFGDYVSDNETFSVSLERALSASCGPLRVINAGIMNTTIDAHARMAERALTLQPNMIVLTFYENDVDDLKNPMWDQFARNRAAKSRFPMSVLYPVLRNTATWNLALAVRARRRASQAFRPNENQGAAADGADSQVKMLRGVYADSLAKLATYLRSKSVEFVFVAYPAVEEMNGSKRDPNTRAMLSAASAAGIPTVDVKPAFAATGLGVRELYLLPLDAHPRPIGHAIAGHTIAKALASLPSLRPRCRPERLPAAPQR